jgi:hypothetical protein
MINGRVTNPDRRIEQPYRIVMIIEKVGDSESGRFTEVIDPEGNRMELWQLKRK